MRALLLFGIDHELKDGQGLTAFDIAKGKQDSTTISEIINALKIFSAIHRGEFMNYLLLQQHEKAATLF